MRLSILPGKDQPVQMIRASAPAQMRFRQLSVSDRQPEAIEELMQEAFSEPFDLVQGPLYRVDVLRRDADDHLLVLTIHHAIADGWTLGAFVQDLCAPPTKRDWQAGPRTSPRAALLQRVGRRRASLLARVPRSINAFPSGNLNWRERSGY